MTTIWLLAIVVTGTAILFGISALMCWDITRGQRQHLERITRERILR